MEGILGVSTPPIFLLVTLMFFGVVILSLFLAKFRQSLLAGYFICGALISNTGVLDFVPNGQESIDVLSELGIVLLMFTLGVEFSKDELRQLRRVALVGGSVQMGICTLIFGLGLYYLMGYELHMSILLGMVLGLSSTAVAMKTFQESGLQGTSGSKLSLGICIFQDILAIFLVAIMPQILAVDVPFVETLGNVGVALGYGLLFLVSAWVIGKYILPPMLLAVARTRSRELFTLSVFSICLGIAMLGSVLNLSLPLGAFIAGLVVSGSYYSHRVLSEVLPFKDLFLTIFFVSAGMLLDLPQLWDNIFLILAILAIVILVKFWACYMAAKALHLAQRMRILASAAMSNVGEFSIVLVLFLMAKTNLDSSIIRDIFAVAAISMTLTPLVMRVAQKIMPLILKHTDSRSRADRFTSECLAENLASTQAHAIICGYGPVGQRLHEDLLSYGIPCVIVDLNADTIKRLLNSGSSAILGDIQHETTQQLAGVERAHLLAYTFPDTSVPLATHASLTNLNPKLTLLARAKYPSEVEKLRHAGIINIVHDEEETGGAAIRFAHRSFDLVEHED